MKSIYIVYDGDTYHPGVVFATENATVAHVLARAMYDDKADINVRQVPMLQDSAFGFNADDPKVGGTDE